MTKEMTKAGVEVAEWAEPYGGQPRWKGQLIKLIVDSLPLDLRQKILEDDRRMKVRTRVVGDAYQIELSCPND